MTTDRERILELLRELMEALPERRVGQIVENAATQGGGVGFYINDRDLLYGLLALKGVK
jgi:hypothetical protein